MHAFPLFAPQQEPHATPQAALAAWVDAAPDALLLLDATLRCLYANRAARALLERAQVTPQGTDFVLSFAPQERAPIALACAIAGEGDACSWSSSYRDAAGRDVAIEYAVQALVSGGEDWIVARLREVSDSRRQARATADLAAMVAAPAAAVQPEQLLRHLAHCVVRGGEFVGCLVWLMQGHAGGLHVAGTAGLPDGYSQAIKEVANAGIVLPGYQAFLSRQMRMLPGLRTKLLADPTYAALHPFWRGFAGESVVCLPLLYGDRAVGSLVAWHRSLDGPDEDGLAFLRQAAGHAALLVENARLAAELRAAGTAMREETTALQLREREAQYRAIFEATGDGLIITDMAGLIVEANPAACAMHGYSREEFLALSPAAIVHPDSQQVLAACREAIAAGRSFSGRVTSLRKDGSTFPVALHALRFAYRGKPATLRILRDVSEEAQAFQLLEQGVEERTRELTTLLEVSNNLASTLELQPLLNLILDQLRALVDYTDANVMTLDGQWLTLLDVYGPAPLRELVGMRISLEHAAANRAVISNRQPVIIDDIAADTPLARSFREVGAELLGSHLRVRSWLGVPLLSKERVIGMLGLCHSGPGFYTQHHVRLALAVANQAAVAIENARLYAQARELAAFNERQRLARELHDSVSQALYGIALGARTARTLVESDPGRLIEPLDYVLSLAEAGLTEMRALIFELRPESLATEGLTAALGHQAAMLRARYQLVVEADLCAEPELPLAVKEALFRVVQEALHNIVKHAHASTILLRLQHDARGTALEITDDGVGFDPNGAFPGHLGLRSMRERVAGLDGTLEIRSAHGQGTHLHVRVPGLIEITQ